MYNDTLDPERQLDMEERIAATIFERVHRPARGLMIDEETYTYLGKEILLQVLLDFRPEILSSSEEK